MSIPANITAIAVTGSFVDVNGGNLYGKVTFKPVVSGIITDALANTLFADGKVEANVVDGQLNTTLIASDDPELLPNGFAYEVTEDLVGATSRTYNITLPTSLAPLVEFASLVPLSSASPPSVSPVTSVEGLTGNVVLTNLNHKLVVNATSGPTPYPIGPNAAVETGLTVLSSYVGGDDDGVGTDSTGRINLYSYQRANFNSFGENIRNYAMRSDAKTMQAFYIPVVTATKKSGYDVSTRDPKTTGVSWKPVVWQGAHFEANNHGSVHGHWELEIPDASGALQGRLEIPFIDQAIDGAKPIDDVTIGVDYTNIRTNLADLSIRAQNITSGPYSGQTTCLRIGGGNDRNKDFSLSISSDMGTSGRRWVFRANNTTEGGSNTGTDLQIRRYDDGGNFLDAPLHFERSTGRIGVGNAVSPEAQLHVRRSTGQVVFIDALATAQSALLVDGVDTTVKALQAQVADDAQKRFQILTDGTISWGNGTATQDVNLYRSAADVLKTDDTFHVSGNLRINTTSLGGGSVVIALANASIVPSVNPTGGGVLYSEAGALKWRGSSGTVTTIANA